MAGDNSKVAKNTIILCLRMMVSLLVSLYTSRVVLQSLGVEDFGIYNVVGGIVSCMSFLLQSLVVSFQRFFCKFIPTNNQTKMSSILSSAALLVGVISLIVLLIVETIGIWLLNNKLVIPEDRLFAANVVLQVSVATFIVSLVQAVFNAVIISFERMTVYAYISIFDVLAKLTVALIIATVNNDNLIVYSLLLLVAGLCSCLIYVLYVKRNYSFLKLSFDRNIKSTFKELLGFSGMSTIGTMSHILKNQGINFLLNIYFGPVVNAARAISLQVYTAVSSFTQSFQTAFSPNMMKRCEVETSEEIYRILGLVSRFSFYVMYLLAFPIALFINPILNIWLGSVNVPEFANMFTILVLANGLIETLSNPILNVIYAKGRITAFMTILSLVVIMAIPLALLALKFGLSPISAYLIDFVLILCAQFVRIIFLRREYSIAITRYFKDILLPIVYLLLVSGGIYYVVKLISTEILWINAILMLLSEALIITCMCFIGMNRGERTFIKNTIYNYAKKFTNGD